MTVTKVVVIDTGPLLRRQGEGVFHPNFEYHCPPDVLDEIKDKIRSEYIQNIKNFLNISTPARTNIEYVQQVAELTGDLTQLSTTDLNVLALAHQIYTNKLNKHVRTLSEISDFIHNQISPNNQQPEVTIEYVNVNSFKQHNNSNWITSDNFEQKRATYIQRTAQTQALSTPFKGLIDRKTPTTTSTEEDQPDIHDTEIQRAQTCHLSPVPPTAVVQINKTAINDESVHTDDINEFPSLTTRTPITQANRPKWNKIIIKQDPQPLSAELKADPQTKDVSDSNPEPLLLTPPQPLQPEEERQLNSAAKQCDQDVDDQDVDDQDVDDQDVDDQDVDDQDVDDETEKSENSTSDDDLVEESHDLGVEMVCMTLDYSMQNVLTAMGIPIEGGKNRIQRVRRWTLRCRCCKTLTDQTDSPFCQSCGYADLHRVQIIVDDNGKEQVLLGRNKLNLRGTIFKPSAPETGKHADKNCLIRPDQIHMGGRLNAFRRKLKVKEKENLNSSLGAWYTSERLCGDSAMDGGMLYKEFKIEDGRGNRNSNHWNKYHSNKRK